MTTNSKSLTHFLATQWRAARVRFRAGTAGLRYLPTRWGGFRPIHATLLLILLAAMAMYQPVSLAATRWVTVQLTDYGTDNILDPHFPSQLSNGCAVWAGKVENTYEIFGIHLVEGVIPDTSDVVRITNNSMSDLTPRVNDDCLVVWRQNLGGSESVVLNDWTSEIWRLDIIGSMSGGPVINNNGHIAWDEYLTPTAPETAEVFLYDGDMVHRLTHNDWVDEFPQIADNGDVVWYGQFDIDDSEIFLYQGTSDPAALTANDYHDARFSINNNGYVTWVGDVDPQSGFAEIMLYDGVTSERIYPQHLGDPFPIINDNDYVVWSGYEEFGEMFSVVLMYDPAGNGSVSRLVPLPIKGWDPWINNSQQVVWSSTGLFESRYSTADLEIVLYVDGSFVQLTNNDLEDESPIINDNGYIMWQQWDGVDENSKEIMMAVPVEVPETRWAATYGNGDWDAATDVIQTNDSGYLVAGSTRHVETTEASTPDDTDAWLVKLDHDGAIEWEKRYGGSAQDIAACVHETDDGYVMAGTTASFGAGGQDAWLLKLDAVGNVIWEKAYGGPEDEQVACVEVTEGGRGDYVFAATTHSFENGGDPNHRHVWLVKVDKVDGNIISEQVYVGPSDIEEVYSIQQTWGGGFVIGGTTRAPELGNGDFWVLKLDEDGVIEWQKAYGQNEVFPADPFFAYMEWNAYVRQTWDGGYILAGTSTSNNTSVQDAWVLKLDPDGAIEWNKWGGVPYVTDVQQTRRGDYVVLGRTGGPVETSSDRPHQGRLMKLDDAGAVLWDGTYTRDPTQDDELEAIVQTWDDGYIAAGASGASPANLAGGEAWVLKLSADGMATEGCEAVKMDPGYSLPGQHQPTECQHDGDQYRHQCGRHLHNGYSGRHHGCNGRWL